MVCVLPLDARAQESAALPLYRHFVAQALEEKSETDHGCDADPKRQSKKKHLRKTCHELVVTNKAKAAQVGDSGTGSKHLARRGAREASHIGGWQRYINVEVGETAF